MADDDGGKLAAILAKRKAARAAAAGAAGDAGNVSSSSTPSNSRQVSYIGTHFAAFTMPTRYGVSVCVCVLE